MLGDEEETVEVGPQLLAVLFLGIVGECAGDEDAGVVHQGIDPAELGDGLLDHSLAGDRIADVAGDGQKVSDHSTA